MVTCAQKAQQPQAIVNLAGCIAKMHQALHQALQQAMHRAMHQALLRASLVHLGTSVQSMEQRRPLALVQRYAASNKDLGTCLKATCSA